MAKKEDKAENPQNKTGAPVPTGQEPPQDNTGEGMTDQPQAGGKQPTPGGAADNAEPAAKNPTKKSEPKVSDAVHKVGKALLKSNPDMSVVYMTADVEDKYIIAQANEPLDENHRFVNKRVAARDRNEIIEVEASRIDFMDVSPKMVVSVATAMIPFLENDDNSRALMGSNMQKQAVPLLVTDSPIFGTRMEYKAAVDSGVVIVAKNPGTVETVTSDQIVSRREDGTKDSREPAPRSVSTDQLARDYPRHAPSLFNLVKNAEESMRGLKKGE